jgi:putative transposase
MLATQVDDLSLAIPQLIQVFDQVCAHCQRVAEMLRKQFPTAVPVMETARGDLLAFLHFPQEHWCKVWSSNPLKRCNKEIKRCTNVLGILPNDRVIVRLVGSQLLAQRWNGRWSTAASCLSP